MISIEPSRSIPGLHRPSLLARGRAYRAKGDISQAIADYDEANRLDPHSAVILNNRGAAKLRLKDYTGAIADLGEALRLNRNLSEAFVNRGLAHGHQSHHDRAIADFGEAILKLHGLLGVWSIDDLARACEAGRVATTKGLGAVLERKILQGLTIASEGEGRLRMNQAQAVLDQTITELSRHRPALRKVTIADLRRSCDGIGSGSLEAGLELVLERQAQPVAKHGENRRGHICPKSHVRVWQLSPDSCG